MKALWNDTVIAESNDTVVVEGNHYFPADSLKADFFEESSHTSYCPWKGEASYKTLVVDGQKNTDAAWVYRAPKEKAENIRDRYAFWKGVKVVDGD